MTARTHFSTFSGIAGMDVAAEWAGFESVGQVEIADYSRTILDQHWPNVTKFMDVCDVTGDDIWKSSGGQSPTILSGGFPCQPFSCAGLRKGTDDDRYLWPEMCRMVSESRPSWVIGENVAGITDLALDTILSELESIGYTCRAFDIPACAVGAIHKRYRTFILAHSNTEPGHQTIPSILPIRKGRHAREVLGGSSWEPVLSNTYRNEWSQCGSMGRAWRIMEPITRDGIWQDVPEPGVCGMDDGLPNRVDRVAALGLSVVPQCVYPFFKAIAEIEMTSTGGM